jgi:hypothetical protein
MSTHPGFQTEIEFELPKGYVDGEGTLHRQGVMRLATAADEILPMRDPRVQESEAYLPVIVLARVITRLGSLKDIHTGVIEGLYASDLAFLENLYAEFNAAGDVVPEAVMSKANGVRAGGLQRIAALGEA